MMIKAKVLSVVRFRKEKGALISKWFLDGEFVCFGFENHKKSILAGSYLATRSYSPRFKAYLFELSNVESRNEILIHAANYTNELEGCLAPGLSLGSKDSELVVQNSRSALENLHNHTKGQNLIVTILNDYK